jgi:hypothetical protein
VTTPLPRVFRTARWYRIFSAIALVLMCAAGLYPFFAGGTPLYRAVGVCLLVFGVAGFIDVMVSRIVLDETEIRVISLVRTRRYPRADLESAKVDGGAVCLKRRDGGWLVLPDTGRNSLAVRNTIHAWIKSSEAGKDS